MDQYEAERGTKFYCTNYLAVDRGKCFILSQSVLLRELMIRRGLMKVREVIYTYD